MKQAVYIQLGVWFPHHKSHVTLIYVLEILSTYMYVFFQLWLCKYLNISVALFIFYLPTEQSLKESCPSLFCDAGLAWNPGNCVPHVLWGLFLRIVDIIILGPVRDPFRCLSFFYCLFLLFKFPMQSVVETWNCFWKLYIKHVFYSIKLIKISIN